MVHLIRDLNNDLKGNPYDEEFKTLATEFGKLLRSIVDTIDSYGLKKRHLHRHQAEVGRFFRAVETRVYRSELAEGYQKRLLKNEGKLFTFLDHDGVPWNNNNAEHAIKAFADYRRIFDGKMTEGGLSDYLVLLSVHQTCKYRGVSFLDFMLSQQEDFELFCRRGRKKKRLPGLDVYLKGFHRNYRNRPLECSGDPVGRGRVSKGRWKPEILAFLRQQGESGARRRDIAEHCIGLIKGGTLVTVVSADDRPRVDQRVSVVLATMKSAGEVARARGGNAPHHSLRPGLAGEGRTPGCRHPAT